MLGSQRGNDLVPPIDRSTETMEQQDGRPFAFCLDVCLLDAVSMIVPPSRGEAGRA